MLVPLGSAALGAVWGWLVVHVGRRAFDRTRNSSALLLSTLTAVALLGLQSGPGSVPPFVVAMAASAGLHGFALSILHFTRRRTLEPPVHE